MITYFDINLKDINSFKVISAQENDKASYCIYIKYYKIRCSTYQKFKCTYFIFKLIQHLCFVRVKLLDPDFPSYANFKLFTKLSPIV